jgi:site-specific DNA recombinase
VGGEPPMIYSEEGEILEAIYGAKNEIEGNKIIQGIKAGNRAKALDGRKPSGIVPYGYRTIDTDDKKQMGEMIKVPAEVDLILKMFEVFLEQDFKDFASYVRYLKSHVGVPSDWGRSRITSMINNQIYNGYLEYDGECTPVPHLRIFDNEDTWRLINDKYNSQYVTGRKNSKHPVNFLLKDKVTCSFCEEVMTTRKYIYKGIDGYYECEKHGLKIKKHEIEKKYLEEAKNYLLEELPAQLEKKYPAEVLNKTNDLERKLFNLEVLLRSIGGALINLTQVYLGNKSEQNKKKLTDLKLEYNRVQEQISSKRLELEKFKGMVKYAVSSRIEDAKVILQTKLLEFQEDELIQFLLTLNLGIRAYPDKIRISWNDNENKYKEVKL